MLNGELGGILRSSSSNPIAYATDSQTDASRRKSSRQIFFSYAARKITVALYDTLTIKL